MGCHVAARGESSASVPGWARRTVLLFSSSKVHLLPEYIGNPLAKSQLNLSTFAPHRSDIAA